MATRNTLSVVLLGLICVSLKVNAVVLNTLNGTDYEWLELSATTGMSRDQVEAQLVDASSDLFGYQYASRQLVQDLLTSYTPWDGLNGFHGEAGVVAGMSMYVSDFGVLEQSAPGTFLVRDVHSGVFRYETSLKNSGIFGLTDECISVFTSCVASFEVRINAMGDAVVASQTAANALDSTVEFPRLAHSSEQYDNTGSFLVKVAVVPVPASVLLFASGIIVLSGFFRKQS